MPVISLNIDKAVVSHLKTVGNKSKYINQLVLEDLYNRHKDSLVDRTTSAVLGSSRLDQHIRSVVSDLIQQERNY